MGTNVAQFNLALRRFTEELLPEQVVLFHKKLTLEALARVVRRTPVDTGRARGNWQATIGSPATGQVDAVDRGGGETVAAGARAIAKLPPYSVSFLTNNVPYAQRLEEGWSQQAPKGMVALTFAELESVLQP